MIGIIPSLTILLGLFACLPTAYGSYLVDQQIEVFRKILVEGFNEPEDVLTCSGLVKLMYLMDGHSKYNEAACAYLFPKLFEGKPVEEGIPFTYLHEVVNYIYGDMISDDPYSPQEIHLQYTNNPTSMKVMWVTMQGLENPLVQYKPKKAAHLSWEEARTSPAMNYTYTVPEKWWPTFHGMIYEVDMVDLYPEESYTYRVGGYDRVNQTMRYSEEFTFKAAPEKNNPGRKTSIFTAADHGTFMIFGFETTKRMHALMNKLQADLVFVAGDLSYAGLSSAFPPLNISKEDEFEMIWDLLGIQNEPVAARIPWMVGDGNHERFYNWSAFINRYKMPNNTPDLPSNGNFWYTFSYGNIQWISLSSEHDLNEGSLQRTFFIQALEQAKKNRMNIPWIVVTIHKPLYCSVEGSPSFASLLEGLLIEYDVDLTLTGHMHAYERIHPVNQGIVTVYPTKQTLLSTIHTTEERRSQRQSQQKEYELRAVDVYHSTGYGPVHVMQGHAGGMQFERWMTPVPDWSAFRMADGLVPLQGKSIVHSDSAAAWLSRHGYTRESFKDDNNKNTTILLSYKETAKMPLLFDLPKGDKFERYNYSHTYGFGHITAYNASHLHYQAIPNVDGLRNHDEFWIVKQH